MRNALLIAWREFAENAKTRGFWFGILLFPLIWIVGAQVPALLDRKGTPTRNFVLVDRTGRLEPVVEAALGMEERRRVSEAFREWASGHLLPGASLPAMAEEFEFGASMQRVRPLLKTNAGEFVTPPPRFRRVGLPPGVRDTGDIMSLETELRTWLKDGREFVPPEGGARVSLFAVALLAAGTSSNSAPVLRFWSDNQADTALRERIDGAVSSEFRKQEYVRLGIDPRVVSRVEGSRANVLNLSPRKAAGEEKVGMADLLRQWVPSAFVYLLWVAVFSIAQMLLNSVIEEKSNRIIEVLLSSVTPVELMAGKLIGIAAIGLVMIAAWVGTLFGVILWMAGTMSVGAPAGASAGPAAQLPLELMTLLGDSWILPAFALYFLLGYVLYSAVILAIGSTCNTIKDAQNYMGVIVLLMMVPLVAMTFIPRDPNGPIATALSWIPPYTPFVMMNRVTAGPPLRDVLGTLAMLVVFDALAIWGCGRVFRAAVLRTGQPASLVQVLRWMRGR
jgi:ABC-2 type transport system permease protein